MDAFSFGAIIRERRKLKDLTQAELARRVSCATITIRKIEADTYRPSVQIAERLAMALNVGSEEWEEFVHLARVAARHTPAPSPLPTPPPLPEEIGHDDLSGRAVRSYELGERLGEGGFGIVYQAVQPQISRDVAIKIILPRFADHPEFIRRFEMEAQLIARLEHPHIVPLYDYWREPGSAFLVMRLLRGGSLALRMAAAPLPLQTILPWFLQIGLALQAAHEQGIVHRDVKPGNILLDEHENAYLADFGIARSLGTDGQEAHPAFELEFGSRTYVAPEHVFHEPIRPQTDIFCMGLLLVELVTGKRPFHSRDFTKLQQELLHPEPLVVDWAQSLLPSALQSIAARALARKPADRYPDMTSFLQALQQAVGGPAVYMPLSGSQEQRAVGEPANPYKGLRPFNEADSADFFGRETFVHHLLSRMGQTDDRDGAQRDLARFLAVVGPSGSGKSSVVRAGLIPALRRGGLPGSERWFYTDMIPQADLPAELAAALQRISVHPLPEMEADLRAGERGLFHSVQQILSGEEQVELVLLIDQFEALFNAAIPEAARAQFLEQLVTAVHDPDSRLRVIITLRADFLDQPLQYVDFGEALRRQAEFVLPLTADELEQVVRGPAQRAGVIIEPALLRQITTDVTGQPGALPLLQYALTELFERREGQLLTSVAYVQLGGVAGALTNRAEALYQMAEPSQQKLIRQMLLRLLSAGPDGPVIRRQIPVAELHSLSPLADALLEQFARYRLLTFGRDPHNRLPVVEIAHDALLHRWQRLAGWIAAAGENLRLQQQLEESAQEWQAAGEERSFLLQGLRLTQFVNWQQQENAPLTPLENRFLERSVQAQQQQQVRERRNLRLRQGLLWSLAVVGLISLVFALLAWQQRQDAVANLNRSEAQRLAAEANRLFLKGSDTETAALLALQSYQFEYTPQGDEALTAAGRQNYPALLLSGHTDNVRRLQFSADGTRLISGSDDGMPRVWDTETGELLLKLQGHSGTASGVAMSPDGRYLASSGAEEMLVRLWDGETGQELAQFVHPAEIWSVRFSPDGRYLLTGDFSGVARLWEVETGREVRTFAGHDDIVLSVDFAPDGRRIVTGSGDSTAIIWDTESGELLHTLRGHLDWAWAVAFAPDGATVLVGSWDKTATLWDAESGELLLTLYHDAPVFWECAAFSPDGRLLLTGGQDNSAHLWDARTGVELHRFSHSNTISGLAFAPDGKTVATGSYDRTIRLWDITAGPVLLPAHDVAANDVVFSADGQQLLGSFGDGTIRANDVRTGQEQQQLSREWIPALHSVYAPDGRFVASSGTDNVLTLWAWPSGELLAELSGHTQLIQCCVNFAPDGRTLLSSSMDGTARLWDLERGEEVMQMQHAQDLFTSAFSQDGERIYTGSCDAMVHVWDAASGEELQQMAIPGGRHCLHTLAVSPDDTQLLVGGVEGALWLLDASTGEAIRQFIGHTDVVWDVAFAPDGRHIVSGSADRTARLWRVADGEELRRFTGHEGVIWAVDFAPDGDSVATAGDDGRILLWPVQLDSIVADLCRRLPRDLTSSERAQYRILEDRSSCP